MAGLTVSLVLIPQSMAYAQLAGLPPYYGLYASLLPPVTAALFGSSRQLATGPVAVVSLMTMVSLEPLATSGSDGYIVYAILLAFMVGAFQLCIGVLKLGLVINLLSHPVVNGFTNAAAIIIATSQLSKLFGVYVDKSEHHYRTIVDVILAASHYTHWPTFIMGILAFIIMYGFKRLSPSIPNILVAVAVTTTISWAIGFEKSTRVDINAIQSLRAKNLILNFNENAKKIESLCVKRLENNRILQNAQINNDQFSEINAWRDRAITQIQIDSLRSRERRLKQDIRELLLDEQRATGGFSVFSPRGGSSGVLQNNDGPTWRIKVNNGPMDIKNIPMIAGGEVIGFVPRGFPEIKMPSIDLQAVRHLLPYTIIIAILGFMEAISIARAMAAKTGQRVDPNQELIGQGLANIFGSFASSYPTSGSFSRSAVNLQSGAYTGLSSVVTSIAVVIVLLFLTPLIYYLPQSVLAAVIMMAVIGLINIEGFIQAWRAQWYDGAISVITLICTLVFAPHLERGIFIGVGLSLLVFLYKSMRPTVVDLSLGVGRALHDAVAFGLKECRYIGVVRFDGPLFFANASYLEEQIRERRIKKAGLKHIIIVANGINDIDASGQEALSFVVDRVRSAGIDISFSGVNEAVKRVFKRTYLLTKIGDDHIYPNIQTAINAIHAETHRRGDETNCPLKKIIVKPATMTEKEA
jgi:MFS superfamily sulfate permease-like transporter